MTTLAIIDQVGGWWNELTVAKQMFFGIGLIAALVSVVLGVLAMIGMEHHEASDGLSLGDLDHAGAGVLSIKPLTGFFLGFGWAGGFALDAGLPLLAALLIATASGGILMGIVVLLIRTIYSLKSDGTAQVEKAVGGIGTVYVTIPARRGAGGQVIVNFSGRQETLAALHAGEQSIASGEKVRVLELIDRRTVLVEAL